MKSTVDSYVRVPCVRLAKAMAQATARRTGRPTRYGMSSSRYGAELFTTTVKRTCRYRVAHYRHPAARTYSVGLEM